MLKILDIYFAIETKDILVDFLLEKGYDDFYFFTCNRYSSASFLISAQEQVSARRSFGLFRLFIQQNEGEVLAQDIKKSINDKHIKVYMQEANELL